MNDVQAVRAWLERVDDVVLHDEFTNEDGAVFKVEADHFDTLNQLIHDSRGKDVSVHADINKVSYSVADYYLVEVNE